jgi:hypothetical protein
VLSTSWEPTDYLQDVCGCVLQSRLPATQLSCPTQRAWRPCQAARVAQFKAGAAVECWSHDGSNRMLTCGAVCSVLVGPYLVTMWFRTLHLFTAVGRLEAQLRLPSGMHTAQNRHTEHCNPAAFTQ